MVKALYRKYRPTTLSEIKGQESVLAPLTRALKNHKISHAYLFTGPRGTGKTSIARIFAHAINDFDYELEDDYVDIIEIDAASNTGVENIRELRETAIVAPTKGKYKVYIIDEVHMLSKSAFNALLKILEEPPEHVVFIMATTDPQKIPPTIISRAQRYLFNLASPDVMKAHLSEIAKKEKIKISDDALDIIVRRGGGSFRDSISLLDQISNLSDQDISAEDVNLALGLPQDQQIATLLESYIARDVTAITDQLKTILNTGAKPETIAEEALRQIIDTPKPPLLPLLATLPNVKAPFPEAKLLLSFLQSSAPPLAPSSPAPRQFSRSSIPSTPANPATNTSSPDHSPATPTKFNLDQFLTTLQSTSPALYSFLHNAKFSQQGTTLNIYTANPGIVNSANNKALLAKLSGLAVNGISLSEYKSSNFGQISDIMGNVEEVTDTNGNPFS